MTILERIKKLCREKKDISLTALEQELGYSNGSLSKAKDIPSSRISKISDYLEVSTDYIIKGKEFDITIEMANADAYLSSIDNRIKEYALKMNGLSDDDKDYIMYMIDKIIEKRGN